MGAPVIVQQSAPTVNWVQSFTTTPTIGNWVVVLGDGTPNPGVPTDNQAGGGNSYSLVTGVPDNPGGNGSWIWYALITKSSGTFTVSQPTGYNIQIFEISGATGFDGTPGSTASDPVANTAVTQVMGTLTNAYDLLLAVIQPSSAEELAPGVNWNTLIDQSGGYIYSMYQITSSALGAYTATATMASSDVWTIAAVAIKGSSGAKPTRVYANGQFYSTQFVEATSAAVGNKCNLKMYGNNTTQIQKMVEYVGTSGISRLYANGTFATNSFSEL